MNKKGFTLVELITTFALTAVIVLLLTNVVIIIKNVYSKTNYKTELYINQSNLSNALNSKISRDNLESYAKCSDEIFCYEFNFIDGESITLIVNEKQIKFGDFVYNLNNKTSVQNPTLKTEYFSDENALNDSFLVISIPIKSEIYPNIDFGINLVYPFISSEVSQI